MPSHARRVASRRFHHVGARLGVAAVALAVLAGCADSPDGAVDDPAATDSAAPVAAVDPGTSTSPAEPEQIPDDFPLAAELPATNGDDASPVRVVETSGLAEIELCGRVFWSPTTPVASDDVAGVTYRGEAEDVRTRTLALYRDAATARRAFDHARTAMGSCPTGEVGGTDQVYEEQPGDAGTATFTHRYRTDGVFDVGLEVIQLVHVGSALYLASYYGEGGGSPATIASAVDVARASSAPVVAALSDFDA